MSRKTKTQKALKIKGFLHIFLKNSIFLNVDKEKYLQNMIQKRLSWKKQTDNLCMSALLLFRVALQI